MKEGSPVRAHMAGISLLKEMVLIRLRTGVKPIVTCRP
jgi:hypothetical protein